ncbi:MAG: hypothetical protein LBR38_10185 [Synergistaceae bacterium]|jgi:hypothetical protein|nr:hypothetical protein [Synergistaceae bacterium]
MISRQVEDYEGQEARFERHVSYYILPVIVRTAKQSAVEVEKLVSDMLGRE